MPWFGPWGTPKVMLYTEEPTLDSGLTYKVDVKIEDYYSYYYSLFSFNVIWKCDGIVSFRASSVMQNITFYQTDLSSNWLFPTFTPVPNCGNLPLLYSFTSLNGTMPAWASFDSVNKKFLLTVSGTIKPAVLTTYAFQLRVTETFT